MGDDGFVVSNKTRLDIFAGLMAGENDFGRLVKKHRILKPAAERALRELEEHGLVAREGAKLTLTPKGEDVSRDLKRQDAFR